MFKQVGKIAATALRPASRRHGVEASRLNVLVGHRYRVLIAMVLILLSLTPQSVMAQDLFAPPSPVKVSVVSMVDQTTPDGKFVLAVTMDIQKPWHVNGSKDQIPEVLNYLIPTQITIPDKPDWLAVGRMQLPKTHVLPVTYTGTPVDLPVFEGKVSFFVPIWVKKDTKAGQYTIPVQIRYQTCDDKSCLAPKTESFEVLVKVGDKQIFAPAMVLEQFNEFDTAALDDFTESSGNLGESGSDSVVFDAFGLSFSLDGSGLGGMLGLLLMAMVGGALLNLTPCVLPVIPLKIMLLHKSAGTRGKGMLLGLFMSLGVMGFWLALGIAIAGISDFSQVNQLFQYPLFNMGMGILICLLAIGMCGLFSVKLPNSVYNVTPKHDTFTGSVLFGIMTAVLSTPCTGPFMGAAAAWSATQPALVTVAIFAAIGAGMAIPYLILSAFPALAKKMPSAGPASVLVKQFLGLCLLAAGSYFLGVGLNGLLTQPPDEPGLWHWWMVCGILALAGYWMAYRSIKLGGKRPAAITWAIIGLLITVGSLNMGRSLTAKGPIDWVMYTPDRMAQAQRQGKVVLVDFTAQWCLNCQVLEHQVLYSEKIVDFLTSDRIVPMKVDLTSANPDGADLLQQAGRVTIPLLVIYDADGQERFKSDSYTVGQVSQILEQLTGSDPAH